MGDEDLEERIFAATFGRGRREPTGPRVRKRRCLIILLLMFVVSGAVDPFLPDGSRVSLVLTLPAAAAILVWCLYDAAERSCQVKVPMRILIFGFACVGVPVYLLRTRGLKGIVSIGLAVLFFSACALLAGLSRVVMQVCLGGFTGK